MCSKKLTHHLLFPSPDLWILIQWTVLSFSRKMTFMKICDKLMAKVLCWLFITQKTCTPFLVLTKASCATLGYHFTKDLAKLWAWQCFIDNWPLNSERLFRWSMRFGSWFPFVLAPPSVKWAIGITFLLSFVLYLQIVNFSEQEFSLFYRSVQ